MIKKIRNIIVMETTDLKQFEEILSKYNLPEEVQQIFWTLLEIIHQQAIRIEQLEEEIRKLKGHPTKPEISKQSGEINKHVEHPKREYKKNSDEFNAVRKEKLSVDEVREVSIEIKNCPKCSGSLHSRGTQGVKIQELSVKRKVIEFRLEKKQCCQCDYFEMAQIDEEYRGSSFGPELRSWISLFHYRHRLTEPQILELLDSLGIVISSSEINNILLSNGKILGPVSEQILQKGLEKSKYINIDESGWKTKGIKNYIWTVCNNTFSYFSIHPKRNSEVANNLVSSNPSIIPVSDDYSSYGEKFNPKDRQLCWIHEIRHYEKLTPFTKLFQEVLSNKLSELWTYYKEIQAYRKCPSKSQKERLFNRFDEIVKIKTPYDELNKRLLLTAKKKERLLVCLNSPEVPPENNCAERALRHAVVIRNISRGSRSKQGEKALTSHLSFFETCKKLRLDVKEQLRKILLLQSTSTSLNFAFT